MKKMMTLAFVAAMAISGAAMADHHEGKAMEGQAKDAAHDAHHDTKAAMKHTKKAAHKAAKKAADATAPADAAAEQKTN